LENEEKYVEVMKI